MPKTIDFCFDFVSPTTFLAHKRMPGLIKRTGAEVRYMPVFLGGIMKASGNSPPFGVAAKAAYMIRDLARFAQRDGIEYNPNPFFPINTLPLMRIATALEGDERFMPFVEAMFDAIWKRSLNLGDADVLASAIDDAGLASRSLLPLANDQRAKDVLKGNTEVAAARGMFGVPTFFVDDEMFFGQDRMDFVEEYALR